MDELIKIVQEKLPNNNYMSTYHYKDGSKYISPSDYDKPKDWRDAKSRLIEAINLLDNTKTCFNLTISDKALKKLKEDMELINVSLDLIKDD